MPYKRGTDAGTFLKQLYEAGAKMAERIIRSGKLTEDPMQLEVRGPICYAKSGIGLGRRQ